MSNIANEADHAADKSALPGLTVERTKALVTIIVTLFALVNAALSFAGINQLPFTSDEVSAAVFSVIGVIGTIYSWWKNQNMTKAGYEGSKLTAAIKNGTVAETQGTDATSLPDGVETLSMDDALAKLEVKNA